MMANISNGLEGASVVPVEAVTPCIEARGGCAAGKTTRECLELRTGLPLDAATFQALRSKVVLEGCKWDPQVGDIDTLSPFPLVMKSSAWNRIASQSEQLAREAVAAEQEILRRPELLKDLGLPRSLSRVLAGDGPLTPNAGRVMRFDFHPTTNGWQISEVNSDVPGGFSEASHFTSAMAAHYPRLRMAGYPAGNWSNALADMAGPRGVVALLSAPGYMEDHQVVAFLATQLRRRGLRAYLAHEASRGSVSGASAWSR